MDIFLDSDAGVGLAVQIYEQIRAGIVAGRFNAGDRLPPTRELATTLGVSRHTVTTAYGRLSAEGYLNGNQGGGTVVAATVETDFRRAEMSLQTPQAVVSEPQRYPYDLRVGTPDARLFPLTEWKRRARWAVDGLAPGYGDPAGSVDLRKVLARWIGLSRGVETTFRQVVVTSGAQQALYLVSRVVAGTGGVVAVEDPGYPRFRAILEAIGASVVPVPVDDEGIVVSGLPPAAQIV